jgi:predicted ArsR family transcriptional regulator
MTVSPRQHSKPTPTGNHARLYELSLNHSPLTLVVASEYLNIHRDTVRRGFYWLAKHGYVRFTRMSIGGRGNSLTIEAIPLHERQEERHAHATTRN